MVKTQRWRVDRPAWPIGVLGLVVLGPTSPPASRCLPLGCTWSRRRRGRGQHQLADRHPWCPWRPARAGDRPAGPVARAERAIVLSRPEPPGRHPGRQLLRPARGSRRTSRPARYVVRCPRGRAASVPEGSRPARLAVPDPLRRGRRHLPTPPGSRRCPGWPRNCRCRRQATGDRPAVAAGYPAVGAEPGGRRARTSASATPAAPNRRQSLFRLLF